MKNREEEKVIYVEYKWGELNRLNGDLVCEITKILDEHLIPKYTYAGLYCYLYNDISTFSKPPMYQMPVRIPRRDDWWNFYEKIRFKQI